MGTTGCKVCGSEFETSPVTRGRPKSTFCSTACKWQAGNDKRAAKRRAARAGRTCSVCSSAVPDSRVTRATTCSEECGRKLNSARIITRKREQRRAVQRICKCGAQDPQTLHARSVYCSPTRQKEFGRAAWSARQAGYNREYKYGVTPGRFAEILATQENRCAICRTDEPGGKGGWHLDHCHTTGKNRGLLCHQCNLGLGNFKDNPDALRAAIAYLEIHAN